MKVNLSDGEWKLMNKLWQGAPLTITQLTAALHSETGWGKHTVITMLSRLEGKGAVEQALQPQAEPGGRGPERDPQLPGQGLRGPAGADDVRHGRLPGPHPARY